MGIPQKLDDAIVLYATMNDGKVNYGTVYNENESREEIISALSICKYPEASQDEIYLFSCNSKWEVIGDTLHESVVKAKTFAEEYYGIKEINWIKT